MKHEEDGIDALFLGIVICVVVIIILIWGAPVAPTPRVWIRP